MAVELLLLPRGAAAARVPVRVLCPRAGRPLARPRRPMPGLPQGLGEPRHARARRPPVAPRPRGRRRPARRRRRRGAARRRVPGGALLVRFRRATPLPGVTEPGAGPFSWRTPGQGEDDVYGLTRGTITLIGVAAAFVLLWLAYQFEGDSNGDYWSQMALVAGAGLVMALSQLLGGWTKWGWPRLSATVFLL